MLTATFSELRNNAKKYFDAVETGETIEVYRHGKPVALLSPHQSRSTERWKEANPLSLKSVSLKSVSLSRVVLEQRKESR